jgi:hypothetical protein
MPLPSSQQPQPPLFKLFAQDPGRQPPSSPNETKPADSARKKMANQNRLRASSTTQKYHRYQHRKASAELNTATIDSFLLSLAKTKSLSKDIRQYFNNGYLDHTTTGIAMDTVTAADKSDSLWMKYGMTLIELRYWLYSIGLKEY